MRRTRHHARARPGSRTNCRQSPDTLRVALIMQAATSTRRPPGPGRAGRHATPATHRGGPVLADPTRYSNSDRFALPPGASGPLAQMHPAMIAAGLARQCHDRAQAALGKFPAWLDVAAGRWPVYCAGSAFVLARGWPFCQSTDTRLLNADSDTVLRRIRERFQRFGAASTDVSEGPPACRAPTRTSGRVCKRSVVAPSGTQRRSAAVARQRRRHRTLPSRRGRLRRHSMNVQSVALFDSARCE
jgi:hypothetical protein